MANPLKVLTALSASAGAAVSGSAGLKVQQGGLTVESGGALVSAGGLTVSAGGLTVSDGASQVQALSASAVSASGDVGLGGDLTVGGNDIKGSDNTTALTFTGGGHVTVAGDLKVGGNDIKASDGTTALTLGAGTGDVTVGNNLKVGGDTIKSSGGNTALSFGGVGVQDVTVEGDLTVKGNTIKASNGASIEISSGSATVLGGLTVGNDDGTAGSITLTNAHATKFAVSSNGVVTASGGAFFGGDVAIGGTLSVQTINYASASAIKLGDKYITIASGATNHTSLDGSGILFGSGGVYTIDEFGANAHILFRQDTDKLEIFPGISSSAITASQLHIHGASSAVVFNGTLQVDGTSHLQAITASAASKVNADLYVGGTEAASVLATGATTLAELGVNVSRTLEFYVNDALAGYTQYTGATTIENIRADLELALPGGFVFFQNGKFSAAVSGIQIGRAHV